MCVLAWVILPQLSPERCQHGTAEEVTTTPLLQQPRDNLDNQRQAEACNGSDSLSRQRRRG
jgi:hypothetical protein